jgi:hypothetical protein
VHWTSTVGISTRRFGADVFKHLDYQADVFGAPTNDDAEGAGLQYFHDVLLFSQL